MHLRDSETSKHINTHHWQAKQLFKRARQLGKGSTDNIVKEQVVTADLRLAQIYTSENRLDQAREYLNEARQLQKEAQGEDSPAVKNTDKRLQELLEKIGQQQAKDSSP